MNAKQWHTLSTILRTECPRLLIFDKQIVQHYRMCFYRPAARHDHEWVLLQWNQTLKLAVGKSEIQIWRPSVWHWYPFSIQQEPLLCHLYAMSDLQFVFVQFIQDVIHSDHSQHRQHRRIAHLCFWPPIWTRLSHPESISRRTHETGKLSSTRIQLSSS